MNLSPHDQSRLHCAVLGLDVAKESVQAELRPISGGKRRFAFANKQSGFKQLGRVLEQHPGAMVHAGLEATGPYSQALALWLHLQGHRVSLLNPRRVKEYARSAGLRNKTDALDAGVIADFLYAHRHLPTWRPPLEELQQLQDLMRRRAQVQVLLLGEQNRLEASSETVRASSKRDLSCRARSWRSDLSG